MNNNKKPKANIANDIFVLTSHDLQQVIWMGWTPAMYQSLFGRLSSGKAFKSVAQA